MYIWCPTDLFINHCIRDNFFSRQLSLPQRLHILHLVNEQSGTYLFQWKRRILVASLWSPEATDSPSIRVSRCSVETEKLLTHVDTLYLVLLFFHQKTSCHYFGELVFCLSYCWLQIIYIDILFPSKSLSFLTTLSSKSFLYIVLKQQFNKQSYTYLVSLSSIDIHIWYFFALD